MVKIYLFLTFLSLNTVLFGQTLQKEIDCKKTTKPDTINDLVTVHAALSGQTNRDIEKGIYKVLKIDVFSNYYLIFIEKKGIKSTIYSEKSIDIKGQKISLDSTYYFELTCKDTLYNGQCFPIIPDVTYFGKYKGYELGKLNIAENLYGLFLIETDRSILKE
jgi:hypothetical protein